MHIGIDARIITHQMAGIGNYTYSLCRELQKSDRLKVTLFDDEFFADHRNFSQLSSRGLRKILYTVWLNTRFPSILKENRIDLVHAPNFVPPLYSGPPAVATFHDVGYLRYPHTHHGLYAALFPGFANAAVEKSRRIIVPSKSTRDEMIHFYPRCKDKLRVVYMAAREEFRKIDDQDFLNLIAKKYSLPEKFLLCVGTLEPRKNLERFFLAFRRYYDRHPDSGLHLVLSGKTWVRHRKFLESLKKSGLEHRIVLTGYIPQEEIAAVYNLALALAFPSYYEGFGIPAVEAMRCGLPVISSNAFSLPEILQDAAVYFDPFDIGQMTAAVSRISEDAELRDELTRTGLKRAEDFSWENTAGQTEEIYREALN